MLIRRSILICSAVALVAAFPRAQIRAPQLFIPPLSDLAGEPAVGLALRKLATVGIFMHTTAHPDDENNGVLAYYAREKGMRVVLVTATRGDGGQNEIGPELFDSLAMLRTEELLAAHRWDGAEQYFTRAVDFGYSFSVDETLQKWGKQEILGDFVRMIRAVRPDVIVSLGTEGTGGGQHHQTSAILTREAFKAAADPAQFPEQLKEGLHPWQAKKLYQPGGGFGGFGGFGPGGPGGGRGGGRGAPGARGGAPAGRGGPATADGHFATIDTAVYDPLIGCTIGEVGSVAAAMHKCQGRSPLMATPGQTGARYRLADTVIASQKDKDETSLFDGIDTSLASLGQFAGPTAPAALTEGLTTIAAKVDGAQKAFAARGASAAVPDLIAGLAALRSLRAGLTAMGLDESARFEIDFRLQPKEAQFQYAIVLAHALRADATANDGVVIAGQPLRVTVSVSNRGADDVSVKRVSLSGLEGDAGCTAGAPKLTAPFTCGSDVRIPRDAKLTDKTFTRLPDFARYVFDPDAPFGVPFKPTPFRAAIELVIAGTSVATEVPIQYRYEGDLATGEKRMELQVVPAFAVSMTPDIAIVPLKVTTTVRTGASDPRAREIRVTVMNATKGAASARVTLKTPAGWRTTPAANPVSFSREDESITVRFVLAPSGPVTAGQVIVKAEVSDVKADGLAGSERFDKGFEVIEYPHTQRRQKVAAAETLVKTIDVNVAPNLTVGYIMGVGDQVPPALQQLGVKLEFIDADTLAWGNLAKYDVIVTGVRAYERRQDLIANNHRLMKYVEDGGTVICQYNKMEFNQAQYGPYPALVSNNRVTDEGAPVQVLQKEHPAFNFPNRITASSWDNWVQERGLYFLGDRDPRYRDLVQLEDPFSYNPGIKGGALVEADYGKGHWLYVGLGLWRQLPAGTDGAYQLFANLLSLPKATSARPKTNGRGHELPGRGRGRGSQVLRFSGSSGSCSRVRCFQGSEEPAENQNPELRN